MEIKALVQTILWIVVDGMAAIWVLQNLWEMFGTDTLNQTLCLMATALCG